MEYGWSNLDLQKKTIALAVMGLVLLVVTFSTVYAEIRSLNKATINLEFVEDLDDTILEMRRYEKNYLLYQGQENLDQTAAFFIKAREIHRKMMKSPEDFSSTTQQLEQLGENFEIYSHVVDYFRSRGEGTSGISQEHQDRIRHAGNRMIEQAEGLLIAGRSKVGRIARKAIWIPLATTGIVICLFFTGLFVINRKVIKPLVMLEKATGKIGRGDFGPIGKPGKMENEVDRLIFAFNRMVEELEARQEQIVHARKIASLGTLVSGVAHELNNPINNIILTIDSLLGKRKKTEEDRKQLLEDILEQGLRASNVVKNLLAFSRAELSSIQDVDIAVLLNDIFRIVDNDLTIKNIRLHSEIDPDLPVLTGNRQNLQQVFFNLITNAIQAIEESGDLTVTAALEENGWVTVTVGDTGSGIDEENISHIFDPFFTTKEVGKGTGLGLSVSYGIIQKHGGRINVESRKGQGTTFTINLPAKEKINDE